MSLAPLALTFALLVFWTGLGWSLIAAAEPNMPPLKALFLAPAAGIALTILPVFWLSAFGLPVGNFARPLMVVFCCIILSAWIWRRPAWGRRELIFIVPVSASLLLIGFPMLRFGFDWIANANDDWANYNLSAIRFINDGFYQMPSMEAMQTGRDYPGFLWFLVVAADGRPGADLLLAFVGALLGKNPFFIFMPLILAFHGVFCLASAGLAVSSIRHRSVLFAALALMGIAPLSLYAVHQQLIAQVIGLAFMCAISSVTCVSLHELRSKGRIALASVIAAAYWVIYPETVPFFVLAFLVFHASHSRDRNWGWNAWWVALVISVLACALVGPYSVSFFFYLVSQFHGSGIQGVYDGISIFPYFLVPSGLTILFGFSRLGELAREPFLSLSIAASIFLLIGAIYGAVLGLLRKSAISMFLIIICLVAAMLVKQHNDFGVFKIAMFAQAFIWFVVLIVLARFRSRVSTVAYVLLLSIFIATDVRYTAASLREGLGGGNSLPFASHDRLLTRLLVDRSSETCGVNFDTSNPPLIKILGARRGCAQSFIARPYLFSGPGPVLLQGVEANPLHARLGIAQFTKRGGEQLHQSVVQLSFKYQPLDGAPVRTLLPRTMYPTTLTDPADDSIWIDKDRVASNSNRLVFLNSSVGSHYYLPDFGPTTIFATERDVFFPEGKFAGVGRYLLFRVNSSTKSVRLVLDLTTSILGDGSASLPSANVVGESPVPVGLSGHGAARVVSPLFSPLIVDGTAYILLDLGADAKLLNVPRTGLMKLYGRNVPIDYRQIVGFARQIRLVDANADLPSAPARLDKFPSDLANKNLEFSGIYEDGWLGDQGFVALSSVQPGKIVFRGLLPKDIGLDSVDLTLAVRGGASVVKHLEPGPFEIEFPAESGRSIIGFHFSAIGRLPGGDNRPATALLSSVSIEPGDAKQPDERISAGIPKVIQGVGLEADGIFPDGWLTHSGFVVINAERSGKAVFRGMVPGGVGLEDQEATISTNAGQVVRKKLEPGPFEIEIPVGVGRSILSINFSRTGNLPNGDGRNVAALLQSIKITPGSE